MKSSFKRNIHLESIQAIIWGTIGALSIAVL